MTPAIVAALAVLAATDPLTARIAESSAAAQALQGAFDGGWVLRNATGRALFTLEMSDPPNGSRPCVGVWRDGHGVSGRAEITRLSQTRAILTLDTTPHLTLRLALHGRIWGGRIPGIGPVTLA